MHLGRPGEAGGVEQGAVMSLRLARSVALVVFVPFWDQPSPLNRFDFETCSDRL